MTPVDLVSLIAIGIVVLSLARRRKLPEGTPPALTGRALPPGRVTSPAGKDGMHRPAATPSHPMGRLIAWSGAIRRAP